MNHLPLFLGLTVLALGCAAEEPKGSVDSGLATEAAEDPPTKPCQPQEGAWRPLDSGTDSSFRGLSTVSDDVVWVSGTAGTWGRTTDGGETWAMGSVPGAEELDFRDVDAFDAQTAYLMSAGPGEVSRIYKTTDGGESWQLQHTNSAPDGFFDGMAFWDTERGLLYGDPVDGRFMVLSTEDGGASWTRVPAEGMPPALDGEAGFAASGSGLAVGEGGLAWFGTGGPAARVFRSTDYGRTWTVTETPMRSGEGSSGIFSLAFADASHGVVVGGDFQQPDATVGHAAHTLDGGQTWTLIEGSPPAGYRSAVSYAPGTDGRVLLAAGTAGSDASVDGGQTWTALPAAPTLSDGEGEAPRLNAVRFGSSACTAWVVGPDGYIARLSESSPESSSSP